MQFTRNHEKAVNTLNKYFEVNDEEEDEEKEEEEKNIVYVCICIKI